jgi:hypothetical protein
VLQRLSDLLPELSRAVTRTRPRVLAPFPRERFAIQEQDSIPERFGNDVGCECQSAWRRAPREHIEDGDQVVLKGHGGHASVIFRDPQWQLSGIQVFVHPRR